MKVSSQCPLPVRPVVGINFRLLQAKATSDVYGLDFSDESAAFIANYLPQRKNSHRKNQEALRGLY